MKLKIITTILIAALLSAGCTSQKKKETTINISGAFALYPLVVKWAEEYQEKHPGIRFNITGGGAGKGMADALAGVVDLGMFSREISQEEKDKGVWWVGLAIDAVLPTINAENPLLNEIKARGLTKDEFTGIFINGSIKDWNQLIPGKESYPIQVFTRSDACGAAETWAKYLGAKQENLQGVGIYGDPGLAEAVIKDKLSFGFNNTNYAYDIKTGRKRPGIEIAPIDINTNGKIDPEEDVYSSFSSVLQSISAGIYPSPPARELYFVAKAKPTKKAVLDFIEWTLTVGQQHITEAGYVPIEQVKINSNLEKLK